MGKTRIVEAALSLSFILFSHACLDVRAGEPNIVFILCDDLGYGDLQCLNPEHGKIRTPNMDQFASEGMTFTDAHSGSSVCTPTRYGLLTGRYSWRTKLQRGVVQGFNPCLIADDRPTVASFLKSQGYDTAIIGKWHLNNLFLDSATAEKLGGKKHNWTAPVNAVLPDGPVHRGFHYFHGIHHARSMKAIIENDKVIAHDEPINFLPRCVEKSVAYIESRKSSPAKEDNSPFFLYVPLGSPHTPILPTKDWQGKSGLGDYGDFVMQTDDAIGQILDALYKNDFDQNTLVIISSDNGCSRAAGIEKLARAGHRVSADFRGSKADIWDGGHRVPFVVKWPGKIRTNSKSNQMICLVDFFATVAQIVGAPVPENSCEDSVSFLPAFFGEAINSTRIGIVHHSFSGHFAYRTERWKLILARGSAGWTSPKEKEVTADAPSAQLYDMKNDPSETTNQYHSKIEIASQLLRQLEKDVYSGRSTDGPPAANDLPDKSIELWKSGKSFAR